MLRLPAVSIEAVRWILRVALPRRGIGMHWDLPSFADFFAFFAGGFENGFSILWSFYFSILKFFISEFLSGLREPL